MFDDPEENLSWRGKRFEDLKRFKTLNTDVKSTKMFVCFNDWTKAYPSHPRDIWDHNHVRLPWSNHNEFPKDGKVVKR